MKAANENRQKKEADELRESHLSLVRIWVPKDKVVEIRFMAIGLLKESVEGKKSHSVNFVWLVHCLRKWSLVFRGLRLS